MQRKSRKKITQADIDFIKTNKHKMKQFEIANLLGIDKSVISRRTIEKKVNTNFFDVNEFSKHYKF